MSGPAPPGWPVRVPPPGAPQWERHAVDFLFDCCPPWFREYRLLTRHPVVLAAFAERFLEGQRQAAADGLAGVRVELDRLVDPATVAEAVDVWQAEVARLARVRRAAWLLGRALRGDEFVPRLAGDSR
jgi:hypothetical protein